MGTSAAAAVTAVALAPATSAEPTRTAPSASAMHSPGNLTRGAEVSTRSGNGGARSGDFTGDGISDLLARDARNGELKVYAHAGSYSGTATYRPAVTINFGWAGIRWIGQADMNGDSLADVVYVDSSGVMRVAAHSGAFNGTATLLSGVVIGTGWTINDLITVDDWDGNGLDDIIARRAGTDSTYLYLNSSGINGTNTLVAPQLAVYGPGVAVAVDISFGDFTGDGLTDFVSVQNDGVMGLFDFETGGTYTLGYGWQTNNIITLSDVNVDGLPDVLARRASDSVLLSYTHTGTWAPAQDGTAFTTLNGPLVIGFGWNINDVIV
jgi:hypothetical protein